MKPKGSPLSPVYEKTQLGSCCLPGSHLPPFRPLSSLLFDSQAQWQRWTLVESLIPQAAIEAGKGEIFSPPASTSVPQSDLAGHAAISTLTCLKECGTLTSTSHILGFVIDKHII